MIMSNEYVVTLLDRAMTEIEVNLNALNTGADAAAIEAAIDGPVKAAFTALDAQNVSAEEKATDVKALYKKLSLKFHPDKLATATADYAVKLRQLASSDALLLGSPQKVVEQYKTGSLVDAFENMNASDLSSIMKLVQAILEALPQFLNEYKRYEAPADDIVFYVRSTMMAVIATASGAGVLGVYLVSSLTSYVNNVLLNVMTGYHYNDELNKHVTTESMAKFARDQLRSQMPAIDNEPDDDAIDIFLNALMNTYMGLGINIDRMAATQVLKDAVKYNHSGFDQLSIIMDAFYASITKPLPGDVIGNVASIMLRFVQCLLVIPALLMDVTNQVIQALSNALVILLIAAALVSCAAIVLLTNMPLYLYDACVAATDYMSSLIEKMFAPAAPEPAPSESAAPEQPTQQPEVSGWFGGFFKQDKSTGDAAHQDEDLETASVCSYGSTNDID
jgi:hypothetical protein